MVSRHTASQPVQIELPSQTNPDLFGTGPWLGQAKDYMVQHPVMLPSTETGLLRMPS